MHANVPSPAGVVRTALGPVERRVAVVHEQWSSARDDAFIRRHSPVFRRALGYFAPDVRHVERVPERGPVLVVGNHSGYIYMPDVWATSFALLDRRSPEAPPFGLAYDLLFTIPGIESFLRRFGALPASGPAAEQALGAGAAVLVYPGGDWEACRPWSQRNRVDLHGHKGFVRLALRTGVPVVPVVAHGSHHAVLVVARGQSVARALGLDRMKVHVMPLFAGVPLGVSVLLPGAPIPTKVTVEFLQPLDWNGDGASAADDPELVQARYDEVTSALQTGLDRLRAERPHPVLSRFGLGR